jgi:hypothetical protein
MSRELPNLGSVLTWNLRSEPEIVFGSVLVLQAVDASSMRSMLAILSGKSFVTFRSKIR